MYIRTYVHTNEYLRCSSFHQFTVLHFTLLYITLCYITLCTGERSRYSDSLRPGRSGDRIPVRAKFSAPVQTGPGALPSLLYSGYRVSFPLLKQPARGVNHPPSYTSTPPPILHVLFEGELYLVLTLRVAHCPVVFSGRTGEFHGRHRSEQSMLGSILDPGSFRIQIRGGMSCVSFLCVLSVEQINVTLNLLCLFV